MQKDFHIWTELKNQIQNKLVQIYPKEREIWWCSLGLNIGSEQDGKNDNFERPVIIYKIINTNIVIILPITSSEKKDRHHFVFKIENKNVSIILSQIKVISTKRLLRKIDWISYSEFEKLHIQLKKYITPKSIQVESLTKGEAFSESEDISNSSIY